MASGWENIDRILPFNRRQRNKCRERKNWTCTLMTYSSKFSFFLQQSLSMCVSGFFPIAQLLFNRVLRYLLSHLGFFYIYFLVHIFQPFNTAKWNSSVWLWHTGIFCILIHRSVMNRRHNTLNSLADAPSSSCFVFIHISIPPVN